MKYESSDRKLVVVMNGGVIPELGYLCGPILSPSLIRIDAIVRMIANGKEVYECNPNNTSERVRLRMRNVKANNFKVEKEEDHVITNTTTFKPDLLVGNNVEVDKDLRNSYMIDVNSNDIETNNIVIENTPDDNTCTEASVNITSDDSIDTTTDETLDEQVEIEIQPNEQDEETVVEESIDNSEVVTSESENDEAETQEVIHNNNFNNRRKNRRTKK